MDPVVGLAHGILGNIPQCVPPHKAYQGAVAVRRLVAVQCKRSLTE